MEDDERSIGRIHARFRSGLDAKPQCKVDETATDFVGVTPFGAERLPTG